MPILTLTTDFGLDDHYVAVLKGVVLGLAPGSTIVDISHQVPPGDVERAGFLLGAAAPWFPAGTIHLAVVDPGVGSDRRLLAAFGGEAAFVAPDNGLLSGVLPSCQAVRSVTRSDLFLPGCGQTFHGRDRFAPIAAYLLRGEPAAGLGPEIADPVLSPHPPPRRESSRIVGRVAHVDRYGIAVTDIPASWLPASGWTAEVSGRGPITRRASHYAEIPPGEPALLPGSGGTLEIALRGEDLARSWGVARGDTIRIDLSHMAE